MDTMTRPELKGIAELQERIARIQKELAEISAALDALRPVEEGKAEQPTAVAADDPEARTHHVDKAAALRAFDAMLEQMGIADVEPIGAEALQQLMLDEGVNPDDCAASRGIMAMREE